MSALLQVGGLVKGGRDWGQVPQLRDSGNRLKRLWAAFRGYEKRNGGGILAKQVARVVGIWANVLGSGVVVAWLGLAFKVFHSDEPIQWKTPEQSTFSFLWNMTPALWNLAPPLSPNILRFLIFFKKTPKVRFCIKIYILFNSYMSYISTITFFAIPWNLKQVFALTILARIPLPSQGGIGVHRGKQFTYVSKSKKH